MNQDEILQKGIDYENKAYYFYVEHAKKFSELETLFSNLAMQEYRHKRLLEFFRKTGDFDDANNRAYAENVKGIITKTIGPGSFEKTDRMDEVKRIAIDIEKKSFEMYSRMLEMTEDKETRKLLKTLMEMEYSHVTLLKQEFSN